MKRIRTITTSDTALVQHDLDTCIDAVSQLHDKAVNDLITQSCTIGETRLNTTTFKEHLDNDPQILISFSTTLIYHNR